MGEAERSGASVDEKLDAINGKLDRLITRVEVRLPAVEHYDDRLSRVEDAAKTLANVSLRLSAAKAFTSWVPGAVAGAVAGGVVALLLASGIAGAH